MIDNLEILFIYILCVFSRDDVRQSCFVFASKDATAWHRASWQLDSVAVESLGLSPKTVHRLAIENSKSSIYKEWCFYVLFKENSLGFEEEEESNDALKGWNEMKFMSLSLSITY